MEKDSPADELIKSFPPGGENYEKTVKQLKLRYGREELLVEVYVRDLLSIVLLKQKLQKIPICKLYDKLETKLRTLETLRVTKDKYAAMLFSLVESSLPDETLKAWERFRTTHRRVSEEVTYSLTTEEKDTPSNKKMPSNDLDRVLDFLQDEVEGEERILLASQSFDQSKKSSFSNNSRESNEKKFQTRVSTATDLLASNLNKNKLCIFCTEEHNSWNCKIASKLTLHEKQSAVEKARCCFLCLREGHGVKTRRSNCQVCGKKHHLFLCSTLSPEPNSSFVTTDVKVQESVIQHDKALANFSKSSNVFLQTLKILVRGEATKRKARAIIDSGSQRSYILKATAEEMNYKAKRREYLNTHCSVVPIPYPANMMYLDGPIEILIGADVAGKLITGNHLQLKNGITAIETKLGWTVIGRANNPSEKKTAVELQEAARQHFLDTVKIENNRYVVSLPWIEGHLPLPDNFELSEKRLRKVVKRLKTKGLFEAYGALFKEWLKENISKVTKDEVILPAHYLPHLPVLKENCTTKIRPVFDASVRQKGAPSLHDCLEIGVNWIELISYIVFGWIKVGIIPDIRGATSVALFPKLLLQKTWERKLNSEEEMDSDTKQEFLKWMRDIFHLEKVQIPRYLKNGNANEKCSLQFFSDASMYAYAAVAFLRVETSEYVKVQLLSAKNRVSPTGKKKTAIVRLELLAATITARLASSITREIPQEEIYLWSDSTTMITWIKREDAWSTFVQNRVAEIRTWTSKENWRHVPGSFNPADLPNRGCSAKKLVQSRWWEGPDWLHLPADMWPFSDVVVVKEPKMQKEQATHEVSQTRDPVSPISETIKTRSGRIVHGSKRFDLRLCDLLSCEHSQLKYFCTTPAKGYLVRDLVYQT
ncbi:uncharacterized protein LOC129959818 [Argiope bruennichi]|uniref:uncharacterized protein LOC129959818 n=1 Tax=Argiope bruennichi TaxID=94029 RepID=UPI002494A41D|nr:uncharacterized protein LOC129959818 [Argiope bruennichi]